MQDNFYITLPSNTSLDIFPKNTLTHFTVNLAKPIIFDGDFEVALVEIKFSRSWYNIIDKDEGKISITDNENGVKTDIYIPPGLYATGDDLMNAINAEIKNKFGIKSFIDQERRDQKKLKDDINLVENNINEISQKLSTIENSQKMKNIKGKLEEETKKLSALKAEIKALKELHSNNHKDRDKAIIDMVKKRDNETNKQIIGKINTEINTLQAKHRDEVTDEDQKILVHQSSRTMSEIIIGGIKTSIDSETAEQKQLLETNKSEKERLLALQKNAVPIPGFNINNLNLVKYKESLNKFSLICPPHSTFSFSDVLLRMLGLNSKIINESSTDNASISSANSANLTSGLTTLFLYSDCISHQFVGDTMTPLLREIHIDDDTRMLITKTYIHPFYRAVNREIIRTIEIDIRDGFGRPIHFISGDVVVATLHFRRRQY